MQSKQLFTDSSRDRSNVVQALNRVDWNFARSGTHAASPHNLHWFPGNFIPQIPAFLIEILSTSGQTVCDPFAGSGTTGVEAGLLNRNSVMLDANSAAVMVARSKLALSDKHLAPVLTAFGQRLAWRQNMTVPYYPRGILDQWLHNTTVAQLETISHLIALESSAVTRAVLDTILSDTLFACSAPRNVYTRTGGRRRHHWGWVADNVIPAVPFPHDAVQLFLSRL